MKGINLILFIILTIAQSHRPCLHQIGCERFTCADYTKLAVIELREHNFTAYPVCGWHYHMPHSWVRVEWDNHTADIDVQFVNFAYPTDLAYVRGRRCVVRGLA